MADPKRKKTKKQKGALFRVEQFGLMLDAYFRKAGLRKTKEEKGIAESMERLEELYEAAERERRGFAAELRIAGDEAGAAAVESGMERKEWGKFWTRERAEAFRRSGKKRE